MFHVGLGARQVDGSHSPSCSGSDLRRWESHFSSDPCIFAPTVDSSREIEIPFPSDDCEVKVFRDYGGLLEGVPFNILPVQRGCRVFILGLPKFVTTSDFLSSWLDGIVCYSEVFRVSSTSSIADHTFDRSLFLVFRDQHVADRFYRDWHIQFFDSSSTSGPVCYLLFVDKIFVFHADSPSFLSLLPIGSHQIPSCPLCIERIDVNITGIITSRRGWLSNGAVACEACVACRNLIPDTSLLTCTSCSSTSTSSPGIWLCLLCGNVGCGRYAKAHAENHSRSTRHRLSLEILTGRIWDYMDDMFVHRRIVSQPSASIMDLPDSRVELFNPTLAVHPQVSFQADIVELNSTMADQLKHEESKYEAACTQLRVLGTSRAFEERLLLEKEKVQEREMRERLEKTKRKMEALEGKLAVARKEIREKTEKVNRLKQASEVMLQKLKRIRAEDVVELPKSRLSELERLKKEAESLRLRITGSGG